MLTFASWYEDRNWRGRLMRISNTAGRKKGLRKDIYNWGAIRCLVPDWELVEAYHLGKMAEEEYSQAYRELLIRRWNEVSAWLASLKADEDVTLLCHEHEGQFCHRKLVAQLVREHRPDIPISLH